MTELEALRRVADAVRRVVSVNTSTSATFRQLRHALDAIPTEAPVATPAEATTLRAEVERLREALAKIERLDRWHPAATTDLPPCKFATGVFADIARAALEDKP